MVTPEDGISDQEDGLEPGQTLPGGWTVIERFGVERCGRYSTGYRVKNEDGREGFLKALNYDFYLLSDDPRERLKAALDAFSDEARYLNIALEHRFDRVVTLFESGTLRDSKGRSIVSYLIFEMAETDGRQQLDASARASYFESARMLHDVAVGIHQLHGKEIAHQDIRAANVLCFGKHRAKVADLGKAVDPASISEHAEHAVAGDETYAPPELLYDFISSDWKVRRFGCDLYLLGSLIVTFFLGTGMTPQILAEMPAHLGPNEWTGGTYEDVLPYLQEASAVVLQRLLSQLEHESANPKWAREVTSIVAELCNVDPLKRGDTIEAQRGGNRLRLDRYLSKLDRLSRVASLHFRRSA